MSKIKVYKAVSVCENTGRIFSWSAGFSCALEYEVGKVVKPKIPNPLCAFKTEEDAHAFIRRRSWDGYSKAIYKCEAYQSKRTPYIFNHVIASGDVENLLHYLSTKNKFFLLNANFLDQTVFCSQITLLEQVWAE